MPVVHTTRRAVALTIVAVMAGWGSAPAASSAQSLVEMYRAARFKSQAERALNGYRPAVNPPTTLDYPSDSLREWIDLVFPPEELQPQNVEPAIVVSDWDLIPKLGRAWFQKEFAEVRWAYVGSNSLSALDTTFTRELRARLEATFGSPTQTIADLDHTKEVKQSEYVQFEYWFVVNDSIPVLVMDVNGPFERGLVVASSHEFHDILPDLKEAFLGRITKAVDRAAYADYYYLPEQRMWFLTGYDGERYFIERISRPDLKLGRPLLEEILK